jgi:hypothetical protein
MKRMLLVNTSLMPMITTTRSTKVLQDFNLLTGQKQYCFQFPFDECLGCYQPHEQKADCIQNAADSFLFAESTPFPYQGAVCNAFLSTSQEASQSLGCQNPDNEQQQNAEHRTSRMSLKDSPCETVWFHRNDGVEGLYNNEEVEINDREHVRDDIKTPPSVCQETTPTSSASVNSNGSQSQQMQPEPTTPLPPPSFLHINHRHNPPSRSAKNCQRSPPTSSASANSNHSQSQQTQPEPTTPGGLSLAGLSEEEQAFLLSIFMAPKVETPALPKVSNKGTKNIFTKRTFPDASNSVTPAAPDVEDMSSVLQNANLKPKAKIPALPKSLKKVRFSDS